jgi:hypothetical protein
MIPVVRVGTVISHAGQEDTTRLRLLEDVADGSGCPISIGPEIERILSNGKGVCRAESYTTVATSTALFLRDDFIVLAIVGVAIKSTLPNTNLTLNTPVRVSLDLKFGFEVT